MASTDTAPVILTRGLGKVYSAGTEAEVVAVRDEGHTVILITHDAHVAAHADRTYVMRDGELHEETEAEAA